MAKKVLNRSLTMVSEHFAGLSLLQLYYIFVSYFEKMAHVGGLSVCIFVALSVQTCVVGTRLKVAG